MKQVLFICSQNRLRSPTAEEVFSSRRGFEVASAGLNPEAETPGARQAVRSEGGTVLSARMKLLAIGVGNLSRFVG
jgi:predicted protein tyrosine phosphatase